MDPQLCCMVLFFLNSPRWTCWRLPKFCKNGYVVESPVGVTLGGCFWTEGHPKINWKAFLHFIVKSLKLTVLNLSEGFGHYITFQGSKEVLNWGLKSLFKDFIMKHAYGQCFLLKRFSSRSTSLMLEQSTFQPNQTSFHSVLGEKKRFRIVRLKLWVYIHWSLCVGCSFWTKDGLKKVMVKQKYDIDEDSKGGVKVG